MTDASPPPTELLRRVDQLVEAGDWGGLYELLRTEDPDLVDGSTRLSYRLGEALYHTGRLEELGTAAARFETAARDRADAGGILRAMNLAFIAAFELGEVEEARHWGETSVQLAEGEGEEEMLARALHNLGLADNLRGDPDRALAQYQLARPVYERIGHARGLAQLQHNIGISHRDLGRLEDAAEAYRSAVKLARQLDYLPIVAISTAGHGEVKLRQGDASMALALAGRSLEVAAELGNPAFVAEALRVRGLARATLSREAEAEADVEGGISDLKRAYELGEQVGHRLLMAEVDRDLAGILDRAGRAEAAAQRWTRALERFEGMGAKGDASAVRERLSGKR